MPKKSQINEYSDNCFREQCIKRVDEIEGASLLYGQLVKDFLPIFKDKCILTNDFGDVDMG
jgi:hypothetical protein